MTNLRIARLFLEVAPPKFVPVIRYRVSKMLDTIAEEERDNAIDINGTESPALSFEGSSSTCSSSYFLEEVDIISVPKF
ncbi:hypothetical protein BVC80_7505g1 [Macleaya cordata]|uniref:Uncharacterized protein n=1 Tax=Macleaya cordata TaxID=56857 RepID=A0A200QXK3_MACCD|nr:hypothetical protein BVC80_7505g1 [Macleaya cordata]